MAPGNLLNLFFVYVLCLLKIIIIVTIIIVIVVLIFCDIMNIKWHNAYRERVTMFVRVDSPISVNIGDNHCRHGNRHRCNAVCPGERVLGV